MALETKYRPVPYDPKAALKRDLRNPKFRAAWESIQDELIRRVDICRSAAESAGP